jgi:hypothetical protein
MRPEQDDTIRLRRALWALLALSALSLVIFGTVMMILLASGALDSNGGG